MPSIWCPKCQTNKNRSEKCPKCGFIEEDKTKTYQVPKNNKTKVNHGIKPKKEFSLNISWNKNSLLIGASIIIAISVSYLAYSKYKENKANEEAMIALFGTSDMNEIINNQKKQNKKMIEDTNKILNESLKGFEKSKNDLINIVK